MDDQSESSRLQALFRTALTDYEAKTGIALDKHPLAKQLQSCDSVESVAAVLREKTQDFSEFREKDKVLKPLKKVLSVLHTLFAGANIGQDIGLHFPPVKAIHTGLGVLLSAVKGSIDSYDALAELLESIGHFLARLDIYTKVSLTSAISEMIVKILVELLSTLALATKQIEEGRSKKIVKRLFGGEKGAEAILQRIDRLTSDEARITAAETFEVVCGLFQNMRVVMDDGKATADRVIKTLEIMQQLVSDRNKSKRDSSLQDISRWLSPPDPWKNHYNACDSRHRGSATWFIQGSTFSGWKTSEVSSSSLWIQGKSGAGKSVFCSTIIEEVFSMRKAGLASLTFFYCDFREEEKIGLRGLLSSLLFQLCHQSDAYCDMLLKFYSEHDKGSRPPRDDALVGCLKDLLKLPGMAPVYLIVDALDECPNIPSFRSPRAKVLNVIEDLINSQFPHLRICVTSRPEPDIKDVLDRVDPLNLRCVSLHEQSEQKRDIEDYIKSVINTHPNNREWGEEDKQLVINVLSQKSDGMFRWVECQADYICGCVPADIPHKLADLPKTLDETYQRTLREIHEVNWDFAHRLFQVIAVASRPLRVEEFAELLAFDCKTGSIPKFQEGRRLKDPVHTVLSICSSFLAIVDGGYLGGKVIQFSHFSVKEFLTSIRLAETNDITFRRYHISMTPAHTVAAQACLGSLLHLDKDTITSNSLEKWPLAEYAAEHWLDHARIEDVSRNVEDGMKQLFDPRKPHLAVCVWISDLGLIVSSPRPERPSPPLQISLQFAAVWGFDSIVEFLITELSRNVRSESYIKTGTPLHLASRYGNMETARTLIEHGADVSAQNKDGETPLHLVSQRGQVEVARMLIEHRADVTVQNEDMQTPLHLALKWGQAEIARLLIERVTDVSAQNKDGETTLHMAAQSGQVEAARMLVEHSADVSAQNEEGQTPLHLVSQLGQVAAARMLIEHRADVSAPNKDGQTPLHLALQWGQAEIAGMLIEHGPDVTARNKAGQSPLHLASQRGQVEVARLLIERGADVTAQTKDGQSPLHLASQRGQVEVVCMLIECGADVTARNKNGESPLHLASQLRQVEITRMLIKRGADVTARTKDGQSPLHLASQRGQVDVARMLIERGADVSAQNKDRQTPLLVYMEFSQSVGIFHQSEEGHAAFARMLLEHGADVTAQDKDGWTPLLLALHRGQVETACMLIERGVDVSAPNKDGCTPLHLASQRRTVGVARLLIERGADVTAQDKDGQTPLHLASQRGQVEVVCMLIERGADVMTRNKNGESPLHLASQLGQVEITRMLIKRGADVTARTKDGQSPLHLASQRRQVEVTRMLIERGADVSAPNKHRWTPLHMALQLGQVEAARILIEHGADVSAPNKDARTPLHLASQQGQVEVTRMLIERGAYVTALDKDGQTPLHLASQRGQVEVVCMLIELGADVTAQDNNEETPLHLASQRGQVEITCMLIDRGADVMAQNKDRRTPLHLASQWGQVEVTHTLIKHGAIVMAQDKGGQTSLLLASQWGQVEVAHVLIEHGADVTSQNGEGDTPLHFVSTQYWSFKSPDYAIVAEILLKHGADVNARNKDGLTPYRLAMQVGLPEVIRVLLEHGADPGEMPASENPPVTSPAYTLVDLHIPSHPLLPSPDVAESPSELEPLSNDILTLERHRSPYFFSRRFLCSLSIVAIAVALPIFYEASRRR